jgi:hypothetical protein
MSSTLDRPLIAGTRRGGRAVWGWVGLAAQLVFTAGWLMADTWQGAGYSSIRYSISDETAATAPHAWILVICQLLAGLGTICFALLGLRPALAEAGRVRAFAPWMLAAGAVSYLVVWPRIPCQLADPSCTVHYHLHSAGGLTDVLVSGVTIAVLAITPFPLWARLREVPRWRPVRPVMIAARVLGPILLILTASQGPYAPGSEEGLFERALALTAAVWISALAIRLVTSQPTAKPR